MSRSDQRSGWQFLDDFVLRRAGFAFDLLAGLRCQTTYRLLHQAAGLESQLLQIERAILDGLARGELPWRKGAEGERQRGRVVVRALKRRIAVGEFPDWTLGRDWNRSVARWRTLISRAETAFGAELVRANAHLLELGRDARVQEAVYLNSPGFYSRGLLALVDGLLRGTRRRSAELTLTSYLQRFCAKNDTTSYFGPINFGTIRPEAGGPALTYRMAESGRGRSHVYASHWFVAELYRAAMADEALRLALPLERSSLIGQCQDRVTLPGLPALKLGSDAAEILHASSLRLSGHQVADRLRRDILEVEATVSDLARMGLLRLRSEPPADMLDVLPAFRAAIAAAPPSRARSDWLATVDRIDELLRCFERGDLAARIQLLDQLERLCAERLELTPRRGAGGLYMDRFILFDQSVGDVGDLCISGSLAASLPRLHTALDLAAWNARQVAALYRRRAWQLVRAAGLAGQTLPLLELLERQPELGTEDAADRSPWQRFWSAALAGHTPGKPLNVSRSQLTQGPGLDLLAEGAVAAPDIMLAARDVEALDRGDFKVVLAEVHPIIVPAQLHFYAYHPEAADVARRARQMLESTFDGREEAILSSTRVSKITEAGLRRVRIHQEWLGCSPDAEDVPISDLDAELTGQDECRLRIRGTERRLYLRRPFFMDQPVPAVLDLFQRPNVWAAEIDLAEHLPRVEVDGIVIQRERWRFESAQLPLPRADRDSFEFYAEIVRWQTRHGLPQLGFGRVQGRGEVKPFLIDFASPLSCLAMLHECREATGLVVTEMYPGPNELWLRGPDGAYTAEIRLSAFAPRRETAAAPHPEAVVARLAELRRTVAGLHVED